jgi:hypothetical protein
MKRADILGLAARTGLCVLILAGNSAVALADEGGVSFWLPGTFTAITVTVHSTERTENFPSRKAVWRRPTNRVHCHRNYP